MNKNQKEQKAKIIELIHSSKVIRSNDKKNLIQSIDSFNDDQLALLRKTLFFEQEKLKEIEEKYTATVKPLNEKYQSTLENFYSDTKKMAEEKDKEAADNLLSEI
jgi:hypothetical protein